MKLHNFKIKILKLPVPDQVIRPGAFFAFPFFSQQLKRNLSISDQPEDSNNEILTSTPVRNNSGPCKKLITPSKITEFIPKYEENSEDIPEEEDSFDRMCK